MILKGNKLAILSKLPPDFLRATHEGNPAKDSITRQLRQSVWWAGKTNDIKQFYQSCNGCSPAELRNFLPPMKERKTPIAPWIVEFS